MDETPIRGSGNQENNQLLLNAIKNKFATQNGSAFPTTTTTSSSSPPTFTIPALKSFNGATTTGSPTATSPKLNQFIMGQLSEHRQRTNGENVQSAGGFTLPKLTLGATTNTQKFTIPLLNSSSVTNLTSLNQGLQNLKVSCAAETTKSEKQQQTPAIIDLSAALSSVGGQNATTASNRLEVRTKAAAAAANEQLEITVKNCVRDEYCQTDISDLPLRHTLVAPSACGRIICLSYAHTLRWRRRLLKSSSSLSCIGHNVRRVKHKIQRFSFDTKSPDDLVLATLNKYARQSHT